MIVVNGHGGNRGPLITLGVEEGVEALSYWELVAGRRGCIELFPFDLGSVGHAGEFETSVMLEAFPALVGEPGLRARADRGARMPRSSCPTWARAACSATRAPATAEDGRAVLDEVVAALVALLDGDAEDDDLDNADAAAAEAGEETEETA